MLGSSSGDESSLVVSPLVVVVAYRFPPTVRRRGPTSSKAGHRLVTPVTISSVAPGARPPSPPGPVGDGGAGGSAAGVAPGPAVLTTADGLIEDDLAQPHRLRGDLDALVLGDELQSLFERELEMRGQALELVGCR